MARKEHWKDEPDAQDYPAARNYLSLVTTDDHAKMLVEALEHAPIIRRYAKDLLRASRLQALPSKNYHVAKDLKKVQKGQRLSPVLLVSLAPGAPLTIADGYHRICASYLLAEDTLIPCRLVHTGRGVTTPAPKKASAPRPRPSRAKPRP